VAVVRELLAKQETAPRQILSLATAAQEKTLGLLGLVRLQQVLADITQAVAAVDPTRHKVDSKAQAEQAVAVMVTMHLLALE
jgi:hypothetical protein